ncbi:glutaredoxin family protein [Virgibacillus ihumii]|uniref:glutaredoxin family protein n=1 Tax=Virgibacillus ihumii TaxID=2686091 RepID=UPI00157C873B|nr:glutaredoxin family protein [Virgibacillus ihumii]
MRKLIFYTKENCPLCENAEVLLDLLRSEYLFELEERDIYTNDAWLEEYQLAIPVVQINDITLVCEQINYESLEKALQETK